MPFEYEGLTLHWLGHDCFRIEDGKTIYFDPYKLEGSQEKGDLVFVTHDHYDHLSIEDLEKVVSSGTTLVSVSNCEEKLSGLGARKVVIVDPGQEAEVEGVKIRAIAAYNVDKFKSSGNVYHPKDLGGAGYIIEIDDVKIYHAGDTDLVPEMEGVETDIALLPVSGSYVMTPEEAVEALQKIRTKIAIPMHHGTVVGGREEAERFAELADVQVELLSKS
jgi:L-ascorbate metabolism protein UlaG (beta-lactamase superfamily)